MSSIPTTKERLLHLIEAKKKVEKQISLNGQILAQNDNIGMSGPLTDADDYPRNDIDVHQVRLARQAIICLQNDHKELMAQIEALLYQYHAEIANDPEVELVNRASALDLERIVEGAEPPNESPELEPFVIVDLVMPNSPAEKAGLRVGDKILRFGSINASNFKKNLSQIGELVRNMQNQTVQLKVKRDQLVLDMMLIPQAWAGRGLLGCNVILMPESMEQ